MNSRRLARLMGIIREIKSHPRRTPEEMCRRFNISRRQFYKDREDLARRGFSFNFDRAKGGFVLSAEKERLANGMSMADLFALFMAVQESTKQSDFGLAHGGLLGLENLVDQLPPRRVDEFRLALEQLVVADGFGCEPRMYRELLGVVADGGRVVLFIDGAAEDQSLTVDPLGLLLKDGMLYLEADGLGQDSSGLVAAGRIRKVIPLPLYSR